MTGIAARLARNHAEPLWRQIERELMGRIQAGELKGGARLPSALKLARELGVNRHTVRRAFAALEHRGLLRTELGRGTFVHEACYDYPVGRRTRFSPSMRSVNANHEYCVLGTRQADPPARIAQVLGLMRGERAWRAEYTTRVDGRLVDYSEAWFPAARFRGLDRVFERVGSVTRTLAEFGVTDYTRRFTRVSACLPGAVIARLLDQAPARPVLLVESLNVDMDGLPVQYGLTRFIGDRVQLVMSVD